MAKPTEPNVTYFISDLLYDGQLHGSFNYIFPNNGAQHEGYNEQALRNVFLQLPYAITFGALITLCFFATKKQDYSKTGFHFV